mgnify:CR=1 FL=1
MELEELKRKSNTKILLRGKSGRGKTMTAATVALRVAEEGGRVLYVDTEAEGSSTLVALVESDDTQFTEDTVSDIEYVQAEDYSSLYDYVDNDGQYHDKFDLIVVDTLDHKHSYVLKHVTDAKRDSDPDWNEYAAIYSEEKEFMEQIGKPEANIIATIDPDSGSQNKPKGAQTNVHGYFTAVIDLTKESDGWSHKIRNWVNKGDAIGAKLPDLASKLTEEIVDRSDL